MPVVKNYGTPKAEIAPLPASRRTAAPTAETFGADSGDKLSKVGSALYEDELLRQDQVATLEADRKLSDVENKLLYDPKDGALTKRGKDAFGLPDTVGAAYDKSTDDVRQGLTNDRQRVAFDRMVAARRKDINSTLSRHVFKEMQAFDDTETENYLKNSVDAAVNNYNDPTRIQTEVDRQRAAVVDYASRHGLGPEYVKQKIGASVSSTHYNVIGRFIARGEDQSASEYFKKFGDEITDDKLKTDAEHKLQTAMTEGQGMRTADDVWKQLGPKSDIDPVNVDKMLDQVRTLHADDPKLAKAASDQIKERASAFNAGQKERAFANQSEVWKAVEQGGKLNDIRRMPEYLALPGPLQNQVKDHVIDRGYTMQQRARADADRIRRGRSRRRDSETGISRIAIGRSRT
jgi:hypothetical protein